MFKNVFNVKITKDLTNDIKKSLEKLADKEILCGIPDSTEHKDSHVTNAQLMYIHQNGVRDTSMRKEMQHNINQGKTYSEAHEMYLHEHGSPMYRVPPRPWLTPAVENSKEKISQKMYKCAKAALDGQDPNTELQKTALFVQNKVRQWPNNPANNWPPNADSTINGWMSPWGTFYKGKGSSVPMIDSGILRRSIVGIVGDKND